PRAAAARRGDAHRAAQRTGRHGGHRPRAHGARGRGDGLSVAHDILVVGSVALDSVRTPYGEVEEALGGSASYFSLAARHFAPVHIVAVVGEDFPAEYRELFRACGVDVSDLETAPGRTFRWRGEYNVDLGHARTLATELNVFSEFHPK